MFPAPFRSMPEIVGSTGVGAMIQEFRLKVKPHGRFTVPAIFRFCFARIGP